MSATSRARPATYTSWWLAGPYCDSAGLVEQVDVVLNEAGAAGAGISRGL